MSVAGWLVRNLTYPLHERLRGRRTLCELETLQLLAAATPASLLILGPSVFAGWERNLDTARQWADSALARAEEPVNHSLKGVLFNYLSERKIEAETEKYPKVNILDLPPRMIQGLWLLIEAVLFILLIWPFSKSAPDGRARP